MAQTCEVVLPRKKQSTSNEYMHKKNNFHISQASNIDIFSSKLFHGLPITGEILPLPLNST